MRQDDPEVTRLVDELRTIVRSYAGDGMDISEIRRDAGMNQQVRWIRKRLREIHRLTDGEIDARVFGWS